MGLLLKRALDQAAAWHSKQLRKYPGVKVPYMSHLAAVAVALTRHGFDEEVVAAGALHDVIEDVGITVQELQSQFGDRVATLVNAVTEQDTSLPWEERKRLYIQSFPKKSWEAQAITLADKIDNFESIVLCRQLYGNPWAMFRRGREAQLERFDLLADNLDGLPPHALIDEYRHALEQVRAVPSS